MSSTTGMYILRIWYLVLILYVVVLFLFLFASPFCFDPFTRLGDNPPGMTDYQDCLLSSFTLLRIAVYTNTIYV